VSGTELRGRLRYQVVPRFWVAGGVQFDSRLPFQFNCDPSLTADQCIEAQVQLYGEQVVNRINFDRGRIYPTILQAGWSEGVKLRGNSTGGGFETVERHLSILADLDQIAVGITHVATPFPAVIV
jgi:hypothetical protein